MALPHLGRGASIFNGVMVNAAAFFHALQAAHIGASY